MNHITSDVFTPHYPSNCYLNPFNTFPFTPRSSEWLLTCRFSCRNTVFISLLSHAYHVSLPIYPPGVCHSSYNWEGVQIRKVLIMQSSPVSCFFLRLRFKYDYVNSLQHAILRHIQCFFLSVRKVSHVYTTGKTKVLYTLLNFKFFGLQTIRCIIVNRVPTISSRI